VVRRREGALEREREQLATTLQELRAQVLTRQQELHTETRDIR
jgi:hypothetical protein